MPEHFEVADPVRWRKLIGSFLGSEIEKSARELASEDNATGQVQNDLMTLAAWHYLVAGDDARAAAISERMAQSGGALDRDRAKPELLLAMIDLRKGGTAEGERRLKRIIAAPSTGMETIQGAARKMLGQAPNPQTARLSDKTPNKRIR